MQTFLPSASFTECARVLDDRRLGKQRVETFQILRALTWPTYGWKNHPAVGMWRGFVPALVLYGLTCCEAWRRRGFTDVTASALLAFTDGEVPVWEDLLAGGRLPPWLGDEAVHASHRAALGAKAPEHYGEHFAVPAPGEDAAYVWPVPAFRRWPLVRTNRELPLDVALDVVAGPDLDDDVLGALADVADGHDAKAAVPDVAAAYRAGVLGSLVTDGRTLFLHAGADLPEHEPAQVHPGTLPHEGDAGTRAASIARPPSDADVAAVLDVARRPSPVEFRRRQQVGMAGFEGIGLVVVDAGYDGDVPSGAPVLRLGR